MKRISLILAMILSTVSITLAQRTVTGKVADGKGEALIGASVQAKGTTVGTVTDVDGNFSINVPKGATSLTISYVGFQSQDIALGTSNVVNATLESANLAEIVVTGNGAGVDRRRLATDIQTIDQKSIPLIPSSSIDQALVGKVAGAQITSGNGTPGAPVSILLRGINNVRNTTPMYLQDGLEFPFLELGLYDVGSVERIEIAEGAASASLYGAQGANGAIGVFTKKGKTGDVLINFSTSYTTSTPLNIGNVRKANLHAFKTDANNNVLGTNGSILSLRASGDYNTNLTWDALNTSVQTNKAYDKNLKYVDHFDMFFKSAPVVNNHIEISGGKGNVDYYIGASSNYQQSNLAANGDYTRYNLTANLGIEIFKNFKFRTISKLFSVNSTINDGGGNSTIYAAFNSRPFLDYSAQLTDGSYPSFLGTAGGVNAKNPFFINETSKTDDNRVDFNQALDFSYSPVEWLDLSFKYGLGYGTELSKQTVLNTSQNLNIVPNPTKFFKPYTFSNTSSGGEIDNFEYTRTSQHAITSVNFKFDLTKTIKSNTYISYDYRKRQLNELTTYGINLPLIPPFNSANSGTQTIYRDRKTPFVTFGSLINQTFDFGDYAGFRVGVRGDYSSSYGSGSDAFIFPRFDGYLNLSNLDMFKKLSKTAPQLKLRAAYGVAGTQPLPFDRYSTLNGSPIGNTGGLVTNTTLANPALGVQISRETEIGADIILTLGKGQWLNSLSFSPSYWVRSTDTGSHAAIYAKQVAPSAGYYGILDNTVGLESSGFQFSLGLQVVDKKDFSWRFTTTFGTQTSKINYIASPIGLNSGAGSTTYELNQGTKVGQITGYLGLHDVNAINSETGKPYIPVAEQKFYAVASNGWVVDTASYFPYFTPDKYNLGDPNPDFIFGFNNSITIKDYLTFNFQWDWLSGGHVYNQTKEWMYRDGIHSDYLEPLTVNGKTGAWTAFYRGVYASVERNGTKSYFYEDASFWRLRNVSLSLDVNKFLKIKEFRNLTLILSGRNLLTFTKYTGMDPEVNSSNVYSLNSSWDRGTDHNTMPNLRSFSVALNVGF
jgi:TonB-dependent starch-binding outer membrane protein SusC